MRAALARLRVQPGGCRARLAFQPVYSLGLRIKSATLQAPIPRLPTSPHFYDHFYDHACEPWPPHPLRDRALRARLGALRRRTVDELAHRRTECARSLPILDRRAC